MSEHLRDLVISLLDLLNKEEESDSCRVFRPNCISSSRAMDCVKLEKIMLDIEKQVGYKDIKKNLEI